MEPSRWGEGGGNRASQRAPKASAPGVGLAVEFLLRAPLRESTETRVWPAPCPCRACFALICGVTLSRYADFLCAAGV